MCVRQHASVARGEQVCFHKWWTEANVSSDEKVLSLLCNVPLQDADV